MEEAQMVVFARVDEVQALTWRSRSAAEVAKVAVAKSRILGRRVRGGVDSITHTLLPAV